MPGDPPRTPLERLGDADDLLDPYSRKGGEQAGGGDAGDGQATPAGKPLSAKAGRSPSPGVNAGFQFDLVVGYHAPGSRARA